MRQRAVIYARISEDPLSTEKGVQRQLEDCRQLVAARGWELVAEPFVDNDVSAMSGRQRSAYDALMALVDAKGTDRVVTYMTSRLWRSRRDRAEGIERLRAANIGVAAVKGPELDLTTAAGRMLAGLLGEFDTHESEVKAERVARAAQQRAEEGRPNGTIPFGWSRLYDRDSQGRVTAARDVENPEEAAVVREIVDRLLEGDSLKSITSSLNARGLKAPYGGSWLDSSVRKLALRESNVGRRVYRGKVIGAATWPAIVDEAKHEQVAALVRDPSRVTTRGGARRHLLTYGIGECGICHGHLRVAMKGKKNHLAHALYVCDAKGCVGRRQERVDALLDLTVVARLQRPDVFDLLGEDPTELDQQRQHTQTLRSRLETAADDYAAGLITSEQLRRITAALRPQIEEAEQALRRAAGAGSRVIAEVAGDQAQQRWDSLPLERRRAVLAALQCRVVVLPTRQGKGFDPDSVDITFGKEAPRVAVA